MIDNTIHTSSDPIWQEAIDAFTLCSDTQEEQTIVQFVQESGELQMDDVVMVFDDNNNGEIDIFDNKVWACKSFLTRYIDPDFELGLFDDFERVMFTGLAVDQMKLLDRIQMLNHNEEVALLKLVVDRIAYPEAEGYKIGPLGISHVVLKKIYYRLQDLGDAQLLRNNKWFELGLEFDAELSDEWNRPSYEGRSPEKIEQSQLSFYHMAQNTIKDEDASLDDKDQTLDILGRLFLPEVDDLLIEVVQGDYDVSLQAKAATLLGQRKSQKTFDVLKAEILRQDDFLYKAGQLFGCDLDKYAVLDSNDKQSAEYRQAVHEAFCNHKLYDATRDVPALLALGHKDFRWFNMIGADLVGVDLSYTNLEFANLSEADLTGALLSYTTGRENIVMTNTRFGPVVLSFDFNYVIPPLFQSTESENSCGGLYDTGRSKTVCEIQNQTRFFSIEEIKNMLSSDCEQNYLRAYDLLKAENYPFECLELVKERVCKQGNSLVAFSTEHQQLAGVVLAYHDLYGLPDEAWLIEMLSSNNGNARIVAAIVLGEVGTAQCVSSLIENLKSKKLDEDNYKEVAKALVKIQKRNQCVPAEEVFNILSSEGLKEDQIYAATIFLGEEEYAKAGPVLWQLMTDPEKRLFDFDNNVPKALVKIQNKHNVITAEQMIAVFDEKLDNSSYFNTRSDVLDFMREVDVSDSVVPCLIEYLKRECVPSTDEFHFYDVVKILCNIHESGGNIPIELIIDFLNVENYRVLYIIPLLILMKPPEIVPRLLEMLENAKGENAQKINEVLEVIDEECGCVPDLSLKFKD